MNKTIQWDDALMLLGEVLGTARSLPYHLVVCGGAALRANEIVSRVTRDVDVLAVRGSVDGEVGTAWPLPENLREAVAEVATELGLPENWLNASTSLVVGPLEGLPTEVWTDLRTNHYGPFLTISYVGRAGQIPLKLSAALSRNEARDLDDLRALAPTPEES
ncbi:MAG: hypothetical protein ACRCXD_19800 [Luteolibacter sp.]